jgi:ureidoglycolate amidohydrolase
MIFSPCRSGIGHRPDEYAAPENAAPGAQVLTYSLAKIAQ